MKIAISGKGGVGKSTLAAGLALLMARRGLKVLAVDADPDANLAACLGISKDRRASIVPVSRQAALIEERTGAKVKQYGQIFKLNPEVSDIADRLALLHEGVALLVLGAVQKGGAGCACPESVLIGALVTDLILSRGDALIMDMEAGVEHLGRGTARGVDTMIVVVEPGQRSIETAQRVIRMCSEIGLRDIQIVANKVTCDDDEAFVLSAIPGCKLLGSIPWCDGLRSADRTGRSVLDGLGEEMTKKFERILDGLSQ